MRKAQIDTVMAAMLDSHDLVSDLNLSVDRPLQVESAGELVPVKFTPPIENLTPFQTEIFALNLIHNDRRLSQMLLQQGSCDSSYFLPGKARFRVKDRKSTRLNSSHSQISYAVFCLKKKTETDAPERAPDCKPGASGQNSHP